MVGRTGAGKSTLGLALCRMVEIEAGSIHIGGDDTSQIELASLRRQITVIPQEPALFQGTLRFNLDPENTATDEELF